MKRDCSDNSHGGLCCPDQVKQDANYPIILQSINTKIKDIFNQKCYDGNPQQSGNACCKNKKTVSAKYNVLSVSKNIPSSYVCVILLFWSIGISSACTPCPPECICSLVDNSSGGCEVSCEGLSVFPSDSLLPAPESIVLL